MLSLPAPVTLLCCCCPLPYASCRLASGELRPWSDPIPSASSSASMIATLPAIGSRLSCDTLCSGLHGCDTVRALCALVRAPASSRTRTPSAWPLISCCPRSASMSPVLLLTRLLRSCRLRLCACDIGGVCAGDPMAPASSLPPSRSHMPRRICCTCGCTGAAHVLPSPCANRIPPPPPLLPACPVLPGGVPSKRLSCR